MKIKLFVVLMACALAIFVSACAAQPTNKPEEPDPVVDSSTEQDPVVENIPDNSTTDADPVQPDNTGADSTESNPESKSVNLEEVRSAIISALAVEDPLLLETEMLVDLYGISSNMIAQSASFVTMAGTFPDEVILVEAVDGSAANNIAASLQKRLDEVLVQSKTYDAENYEAAQNCKVAINGTFVALILSPKQSDMTSIYDSYFVS